MIMPKWECLDCYQKFDNPRKHQEQTWHHNILKYKPSNSNTIKGFDFIQENKRGYLNG